jgi:hypothetical protein
VLYEKPGCCRPGARDFGLTSLDLHELAEAGRLGLYDDLADRRTSQAPNRLDPPVGERLEAMALWGRGCASGCRGACALP